MKEFKITFEEFQRHINQAVAILNLQDQLYSVVADFNDSNSGTELDFGYFPTMLDNVLDLLALLTDDVQNGWISYWMFELDCGRRYRDGCVTNPDGSIVKLQTIEDLWAVLNF